MSEKFDRVDWLNLPRIGGRFRWPVLHTKGVEGEMDAQAVINIGKGITCMRCKPIATAFRKRDVHFVPVHDRQSGKWHHPECPIVVR